MILFVIIVIAIVAIKIVEKDYKNRTYTAYSSYPSKYRKKIYRGYCVYIIKNSVNKKVYVGMTADFARRKSQHFNPRYRHNQHHKYLYYEMDRMGSEKFTMVKLLGGMSKKEAMYAEARIIKDWHTIKPYGYNIATESDSRSLGYDVAKYNRNLFEKIKEISKSKNKYMG